MKTASEMCKITKMFASCVCWSLQKKNVMSRIDEAARRGEFWISFKVNEPIIVEDLVNYMRGFGYTVKAYDPHGEVRVSWDKRS